MSPCRVADSGGCGFYSGSFADCRADQTRRTDAIHATLSNFGGFAAAAPARVLDKGKTGPDLKAMQTLLIADDAKILAIGSYDNATERATPCWRRLGC